MDKLCTLWSSFHIYNRICSAAEAGPSKPAAQSIWYDQPDEESSDSDEECGEQLDCRPLDDPDYEPLEDDYKSEDEMMDDGNIVWDDFESLQKQ